jgi:cell division protein FtsW
MFRTVGQRSSVKDNRATQRRYQGVVIGNVQMPVAVPQKQAAKQARAGRLVQLRLDVPLLLSIITLLILGLVAVYSASYDYSYHYYDNPMTIFSRQLMWLGLGLVVMVGMMLWDYHVWRKLAVFAMIGTLGLLLMVLFVDAVLNGAARTLLNGSIQPSEAAKLVIVIYLSVWLYAKRDELSNVHIGLIPLAVMLGVLGGLIMGQPDLSAAFTIFILGGLMFFLAGGDLKQIAILMVVALIVGFLLIKLNPTGSDRITNYINGLRDPISGSYHVARSFEAFVDGGWLGVGIGRGSVKLTGLPVPQTDSIFAVIGEEMGAFGAIGLVALYATLLWRGLTIARRAPDQLGSLLAAGLTLWIALEAFINMAVMVNLVPFAGNALPFISSGGSNLVVSLAAVGLILNVSRQSEKKKDEEGKLFHAAINFGGRDWRRGVPGAGRPASAARPLSAKQSGAPTRPASRPPSGPRP